MGRPVGSENQNFREDRVRIHRLDREVHSAIKRRCALYGITLTRYYDMLPLGGPEQNSETNKTVAISHAQFMAILNNDVASEAQINTVEMSLVYFRAEVEHRGISSLAVSLPAALAEVLYGYETDPDVILPQELSALRGILRRAHARLHPGTS